MIVQTSHPDVLPVYTLLCNRHVSMATKCLPTLLSNCRTPISLTILDDGTLSDADVNAMAGCVPSACVLRRVDYVDMVLSEMQSKPASREYCESEAFGLKLFAPAVLSRGSDFVLCDSDILFVRPFCFDEVRADPERDRRVIFMRDVATAYSVSFARRFVWCGVGKGLRLPERVNTGFLYAGGRSVDFDYLEWFLSHPEYRSIKWVVEQTAWAAIASRSPNGGMAFEPSQIRFPDPRCSADSVIQLQNTIALHFISPLRDLLEKYEVVLSAHSAALQIGGATPLRTIAAEYPSLFDALAERAMRRCRRVLAWDRHSRVV